MFIKTAYFAALVMCGSAASAGCVNYSEDRRTEVPEVLLCIQGECSETTVAYECANGFGNQFGYANGVTFDCSIQNGGTCNIALGGRQLRLQDLVFAT